MSGARIGRCDLHPAPVKVGELHHTLRLAAIVADLEQSPVPVLTEREIRVLARYDDTRYVVQAEHPRTAQRSAHVPDLAVLTVPDAWVTVEVERTVTVTDRTRAILRGYR